jgi:hypothetical protein
MRSGSGASLATPMILTGSEPGLAAYYRLDDGEGTEATDASGHSRTATLVNGPVWVVSTVPGAPMLSGPSGMKTTYSLTAKNVKTTLVARTGMIAPPTRLSNGHLQLRYSGSPGKTYRVQTSSDLIHWTDAGNVTTDATGILQFEDGASTGNAQRFYRIVGM